MGIELTLVPFGATVALVLAGGGAFALDQLIARGAAATSDG